MSYSVKLIKKEDYIPTFWSGGMATEVITYPLGSTYAEKNFLWRLGFARIDIPESTFTNLPNVSRHLMVTEGKVILTHENKYSKTLVPFEQDSFLGDWNTATKGNCSVFNLMTKRNYNGELTHISIQPENDFNFKYNLSNDKNLVAICFYPLNGIFETNINNENFKICTGDLLCINYDNPINTNAINTYTASDFEHEFNLFNSYKETVKVIVSVIYKF
ncbi:HutD family protein [Clostridium saccharobutylicum]|uniref:HutD n=1 Tax=Clostridium saccharobutylicum TaxID=169679 RepID=A0A1S8N4P0_CLOSA|nr:HutD family protein [Clostridium saccharobutylicum]OOM11338.1 HutD [Clostridium saccharobutylicum]